MDEVNKIRKAFFTYGQSRNQIAKQFHRSWDTINKIVSMERDDFLSRGKRRSRKKRVITPKVVEAVEEYFREEKEKSVKRKQRYTAKQIYKELCKRGIYQGSLRRMQEFVKEFRQQYAQLKEKSYLPLAFTLGSTLEIDHGEVDLVINEDRCKGYLFVASVPGEVLRYSQVFPVKSQEAWGEFHERALRFFGGAFPKVVYDNDSVLVKKVIGTERDQTDFSLALEEHFKFESHFCNLGSGNEKGAVENAVGYCRRNFLPGCPSFRKWDEANQHLTTCCTQDVCEGKHYKTNKPLKDTFEELKKKLSPLPPQKMWKQTMDCRVDSCQLIRVDRHEYSVPEKYVGSYLKAFVQVFQIKIFKDEELVAVHERKYDNTDSLKLDHYLDQLKYKAGAFWDCKAVQNHEFDQRYLELWRLFSNRYERREANREFVKTLLLARKYTHEETLKAIEDCLQCKAISHAAIELTIRGNNTKYPVFDEGEMKEELKLANSSSWDFDLSAYEELISEVAL